MFCVTEVHSERSLNWQYRKGNNTFPTGVHRLLFHPDILPVIKAPNLGFTLVLPIHLFLFEFVWLFCFVLLCFILVCLCVHIVCVWYRHVCVWMLICALCGATIKMPSSAALPWVRVSCWTYGLSSWTAAWSWNYRRTQWHHFLCGAGTQTQFSVLAQQTLLPTEPSPLVPLPVIFSNNLK